MQNDHEEFEPSDQAMQRALGFLTGILVGGLAGAAAMLLFAPQSGKRTRAQIRQQSRELRDQAAETIDDAVTQARTTSHELTSNVQKQAAKIQQRGQDLLDGQKARWAPVGDSGQKAVNGAD
jgi:gas vesicle protein